MIDHREVLSAAERLRSLKLLSPEGVVFIRHGDYLATLGPGGRMTLLTDEGALRGMEPLDALAARSLFASPGNYVAMASTGLYTRLQAVRGSILLPFLDDMAQLLGTRLKVQSLKPVLPRLGTNRVALIKDHGAICLASDPYELMALAMVLEKSCLAAFTSLVLNNRHGISPLEALLMRGIYLLKYGKTARKKHRSISETKA